MASYVSTDSGSFGYIKSVFQGLKWRPFSDCCSGLSDAFHEKYKYLHEMGEPKWSIAFRDMTSDTVRAFDDNNARFIMIEVKTERIGFNYQINSSFANHEEIVAECQKHLNHFAYNYYRMKIEKSKYAISAVDYYNPTTY